LNTWRRARTSSAVKNAATEILAETCAGQTLLTSELGAGSNALRRLLSPSVNPVNRDIRAYSKVEQAGMLDSWISQMVLT
jgi:hypothetical protein